MIFVPGIAHPFEDTSRLIVARRPCLFFPDQVAAYMLSVNRLHPD